MLPPGDLPSLPTTVVGGPASAGAGLSDAEIRRLDTGAELNLGVAQTATTLSPARARELARTAGSAAAAYLGGADVRTFNVAAKGLGACWWRATHEKDRALAAEVEQAAGLVAGCGSRLRHEAAAALRSAWAGPDELPVVPEPPPGAVGFHALAGGPSRTLGLFQAGAGRRFRLRSSCAYLGAGVGSGPTMYQRAWKPPSSLEQTTAEPVRPQTSAETWDGVIAWLERVPAGEPVLLFGMPVVPARVLAATGATVVNAHNGSLPAVRGLDALAWSVALGEAPTATAHEVVAEVDAGRVLAVARLSPFPLGTVADRLKQAQCVVLAAALTVPRSDHGHRAPGPGRYFGRMHPYLRRILDDVTQAHVAPALPEGTRHGN